MQLISLNASLQNLLSKVTEFEYKGKYDNAILLLEEIWADTTDLPDITGMSKMEAAHVMMSCGAILSFFGNSKQICDAQEHAKNLLSIARTNFIELQDFEFVAKCENYLALTYYHKGEYEESLIFVEQSLVRRVDFNSEVRLHSHIIKSLNLLAESKYDLVILYLNSFQLDFNSGSHLLRGCLATNLSLAYKNIGDLSKALFYLDIARTHHITSEHLPYLATVENNLAQVYKLCGDYKKAIKAADTAIQLFAELGDQARTAFSIDTKASIFAASGEAGFALNLIDEGIELLKYGDNSAILSQMFLTKAKILINLERIAEAVINVAEAIQLARFSGDDAVLKIAESFETECKNPFPPFVKKNCSQKSENFETPDLKLELPNTISRNFEFFGVWIKNDVFSEIGLVEGVLAIIASSLTKKGDLVAVSENESGLVCIGYLDREFGMICLESEYGEPELFDETEVEILGKVVGFCESKPSENNRYKVIPI